MIRQSHMAIDPGAGGGIVWYNEDRVVFASDMPETLSDKIRLLRSIKENNPDITCAIEQVGTYMPGNSGPAAVTFSRHCGELDAILACLEIKSAYVRPQVWQKMLPLTRYEPIPKTIPEAQRRVILSERKRERKREIKEFVSSKFPTISVTLKLADALGILFWFDNQQEEMEFRYEKD